MRVADLLQHINQMKTAEGYGFKQEYEVHGPSPARTLQGLAWFLLTVDPGKPPAQPWVDPYSDSPQLDLIFLTLTLILIPD